MNSVNGPGDTPIPLSPKVPVQRSGRRRSHPPPTERTISRMTVKLVCTVAVDPELEDRLYGCGMALCGLFSTRGAEPFRR